MRRPARELEEGDQILVDGAWWTVDRFESEAGTVRLALRSAHDAVALLRLGCWTRVRCAA